MSIWNAIYPWLVAGIGGALGWALLLPTKLGEMLINRWLEGFKSERSRDLERLKEQLNHLGDRGRRSNEMEFVAIKTVWEAFVKAWLSTNTCVATIIQPPDFDRMSDEEVREFAASSGFSHRDQDALVSSTDRHNKYVRLVKRQDINVARKDIYQARLTLREQRIFMPPEISTQFSDAIERMFSVQVERQVTLELPADRGPSKEATAWINDREQVFEHLAVQANQRLFSRRTRRGPFPRSQTGLKLITPIRLSAYAPI